MTWSLLKIKKNLNKKLNLNTRKSALEERNLLHKYIYILATRVGESKKKEDRQTGPQTDRYIGGRIMTK